MDLNDIIAGNLSAARQARGMSLAELADAAAVSKTTLHDIERGKGNPRLDTLYAVANALDLVLGDLIIDRSAYVEITRAGDGPVAVGESVTARLLHRIALAGDVEVYDVTLGPDIQHSQPHRAGTTECLIVHAGTVEVGPEDAPVRLEAGDSAWFATDRPHMYRSVGGEATATLLVANGSRA